jgi:hypothetical protein
MEPKDNIEAWAHTFVNSLDPKSEFVKFFRPYSELMMEIVENDCLPLHLRGATKKFLTSVFAIIISSVLRLKKIVPTEVYRVATLVPDSYGLSLSTW